MHIYKAVQDITVRAKASEELKVVDKTPSASTNPKDSSISVTFNKILASACSELVKDITVSMGGSRLNSFEGSIKGNKIILKNTEHLTVADGKSGIVTVTIPSSFYYMDGNVKVNLPKDYVFTYVVDSSSIAQAEIIFIQTSESGTMTPQNRSTQRYSLDKEVPIRLDLKDGWKFNGWSIEDADGNEVPESKIKILDKKATSTKLYVYQEIQGVTVFASACEKLSVSGSPNILTDSGSNPKDSEITLNFNRGIYSKTDLSKIRVTMDGDSLDSYFETRVLSADRKNVKLINTKQISVAEGSAKTVTVTVPSSFYYLDGNQAVSLENDYIQL